MVSGDIRDTAKGSMLADAGNVGSGKRETAHSGRNPTFFVLRTIIGPRRSAAQPHSYSTSLPTPPATPAVMREVMVEGHTITAQELLSDDCTPVLCKAYVFRPASSPKPPHHSCNATSDHPNVRNAACDAAATTGSGKTTCVQGDAPHSELRLLDVPTPRLRKAVQTQFRIPLPDDFCLHIRPTNNTFTMATTHFPTADTLKRLTCLAIGDNLPRVITNAYDDETPTQLYQDLVRRNPEYTILAARSVEKTHSILITLDVNAVPHSIKYMGAIHHCTPHRGSPDACTNCRQPGDQHDVCQSPKTNLCPHCATQHWQQDPPWPSSYRHGIVQGTKPSPVTEAAKPPRNAAAGIGPAQTEFPPVAIWTHPAQPTQARLDRAIEHEAWDTPLSSHKHATSVTANPSLQHAMAKSQEETAAAKAEATTGPSRSTFVNASPQ
ncbi:hypothetical protein HPB49_016759 [Dermacentor silvarum]|uniref:Uncharacterized protein n=1 Tax=Dermacentor silvarum TaxID=543639 RepID=A0ACB8C4H8_DERSI|nr:hypothetical protein HPB49_016759 [Dermacentor silvarum]